MQPQDLVPLPAAAGGSSASTDAAGGDSDDPASDDPDPVRADGKTAKASAKGAFITAGPEAIWEQKPPGKERAMLKLRFPVMATMGGVGDVPEVATNIPKKRPLNRRTDVDPAIASGARSPVPPKLPLVPSSLLGAGDTDVVLMNALMSDGWEPFAARLPSCQVCFFEGRPAVFGERGMWSMEKTLEP